VQREAGVLEVGRGCARHVRHDLAVVVGLLADRGDVDHANARLEGARPQSGKVRARRGEHRQPLLEQPRVHLPVGVDEVLPGEAGDGRPQRDGEDRGGVGGRPRRQPGVDHDRAALRLLSGHDAPP